MVRRCDVEGSKSLFAEMLPFVFVGDVEIGCEYGGKSAKVPYRPTQEITGRQEITKADEVP